MRGFEQQSDALFVYLSPEPFVPKKHPLRPIRQMVYAALENLSPVLSQMYSHTGRPSIPPERLLKAMLLQVLYSIPSNVKLEVSCQQQTLPTQAAAGCLLKFWANTAGAI